MLSPKQLHARRTERTRYNLRQNAKGRLRLSIHRSGKHMYAQIIDDSKSVTLVAASTIEKDLRGKTGADKAAAKKVGQRVAERALKAGILQVVFDRGGYLYHGRVRELAEAAREAGLSF